MSKFVAWIDERLPVSNFVKNHLSQYYAPKNFNFFYYFGALAIFIFILQIVTGIFLTINYKPDATEALASVEYIVRDGEFGWLIRKLHSTGTAFFFIDIYLNMFRAMLDGCYKNKRELLWLVGRLIFVLLMNYF